MFIHTINNTLINTNRITKIYKDDCAILAEIQDSEYSIFLHFSTDTDEIKLAFDNLIETLKAANELCSFSMTDRPAFLNN